MEKGREFTRSESTTSVGGMEPAYGSLSEQRTTGRTMVPGMQDNGTALCDGPKNWLFSNILAAAQSSTVIYSLIEASKKNDLNPYRTAF